jgi:hypothetical protein
MNRRRFVSLRKNAYHTRNDSKSWVEIMARHGGNEMSGYGNTADRQRRKGNKKDNNKNSNKRIKRNNKKY